MHNVSTPCITAPILQTPPSLLQSSPVKITCPITGAPEMAEARWPDICNVLLPSELVRIRLMVFGPIWLPLEILYGPGNVLGSSYWKVTLAMNDGRGGLNIPLTNTGGPLT